MTRETRVSCTFIVYFKSCIRSCLTSSVLISLSHHACHFLFPVVALTSCRVHRSAAAFLVFLLVLGDGLLAVVEVAHGLPGGLLVAVALPEHLVLDVAVVEDSLAHDSAHRELLRDLHLVRGIARLPAGVLVVDLVLALGDAAAGHGVLGALLGALEVLDDLLQGVALGRVLDEPGVVVVHLLLNEEAGLPSQSRCFFSFRTTARACIGERRRRDSTSDANPTSEESIVDGVVRARNTSRSTHARAIEGSAREGKGRAWKGKGGGAF